MRLLRWSFRLLLGLVVVVLSLVFAATALLASETGTRWLFDRAPGWLAPLGVELRIGGVEGSLVGRLDIDDLRVATGDLNVEIETLRLHWRPRALLVRRIDVTALRAAGIDVALPPPAAGDSEEPSPGGLSLPELSLPVSLRVRDLDVDRLRIARGDQAWTIDEIDARLGADAGAIDIAALSAVGEGVSIDGFLFVRPTAPHAVTASIRLGVDPVVTGEQVGPVQARIGISGPVLGPDWWLAVTQPTSLRAHGALRLAGESPQFEAEAAWPRLAWPLSGESQVVSRDGRLRLAGTPDAYRIDGGTRVEGGGLPATGIALKADGGLDGLKLVPLRLDTLDGRIDITGAVTWTGQPAWDLSIAAEQIDPGVLAADWPGRLNGAVDVVGGLSGADDAPVSTVTVSGIEGDLRGYPVRVAGRADWRDGRLKLDGLDLRSGANRILANGVLGDRLDADLDVDAPDLAALYPGLAGAVDGTVAVGGTTAVPTLQLELRGNDIALEGNAVRSLTLDGTWRPDAVGLDLRFAELDVGGMPLDAVTLGVDGQVDGHRIVVDVSGPEIDVTGRADGGWDGNRWQGRLAAFELDEVRLGAWSLDRPVPLSLAADAADVGRLCLRSGDESLCAEGRWTSAGTLAAQGELAGLVLGRLEPWLPGEARVDGRLDGRFRVDGTTARPVVDALVLPGDGRILLDTDDGPLELGYNDARLELDLADDRFVVTLGMRTTAQGRVQGRVVAGPAGPDGRPLDGELDAVFPDLGLLAGFVPALSDVRGGFRVDVRIDGTDRLPVLTGTLRVEDARAELVPAGIVLEDIDLRVDGDGDGPLRLQGSLRSGKGALDLSGSVTPFSGSPALDLQIEGRDFQAVRLPEATVTLSPDLRIEGQEAFRVSGSVRVPQAHVKLATKLPQGVASVSPDEVIVGETPDTGPEPVPVSGAVRVELGDDVTFEGFGLETGLTGAIDARFDAQTNTVNGKIEMRDGEYRSYGQDLTVERGRLLFAGPPDRPDVDLRAVRESRDGRVRAYLELTGPLREPRTRIYSEPALPQSEALAYLVTGRGLGQASGGEGLDIANAALALGVARGEPWLAELSDRVGLDEIRVETGETLEQSSVLLGKYLNPDLYVGYTQELFNPEGALLLRLKLSERFEVETRSGRNQSVDLFYRYEHD